MMHTPDATACACMHGDLTLLASKRLRLIYTASACVYVWAGRQATHAGLAIPYCYSPSSLLLQLLLGAATAPAFCYSSPLLQLQLLLAGLHLAIGADRLPAASCTSCQGQQVRRSGGR